MATTVTAPKVLPASVCICISSVCTAILISLLKQRFMLFGVECSLIIQLFIDDVRLKNQTFKDNGNHQFR